MKARTNLTISLLSAITLFALATVAGCGKKNNTPAPIPPPANTNPNGGFVGGISCGSVSGVGNLRANGAPFYSQLVGQTGSSVNGLALSLMYSQTPSADSYSQSVVGSAQFNFADIQMMSQYPLQAQSTNICLSSASPGYGGGVPGIYYPGQNQLQITLKGAMQVPLYSPYGNFPGGSYGPTQVQYGQEQITMMIGYGCPAYLYEGRLYGCVQVYVGTSGNYSLQYQAQ